MEKMDIIIFTKFSFSPPAKFIFITFFPNEPDVRLSVYYSTDPKCKLNISSFLTFPHLSDVLICTRNSVSIVFLLEMVGLAGGG